MQRHSGGVTILNTGQMQLTVNLFHRTTDRKSFCLKINWEEYLGIGF